MLLLLDKLDPLHLLVVKMIMDNRIMDVIHIAVEMIINVVALIPNIIIVIKMIVTMKTILVQTTHLMMSVKAQEAMLPIHLVLLLV